MVNNLLNVPLDPIGYYLVENFCICVHQGYGLYFSFLVGPLSGFGIKVMLASQNEFGSIPSLSIFSSSFSTIGIVFFSKGLIEFP